MNSRPLRRGVGLFGLLLAMSCQTSTAPDPAPAERKFGAANVTNPEDLQFGRMTKCPVRDGPGGMTPDEQRREIEQIYTNLSDFMGTTRQRPPRLIFDQGDKQEPPYYLPDRHAIVVGSKMHDVCAAALGSGRKACLAFFLGHELTHFTREHGKLVGVTDGVRERFSMAQAMHLNEQAEAQADTEGGFFSFLAGYDTLEVSAPSLDAMYTCYGLRDKISGYLSLPKRKALLSKVTLKLKQLALLFDTANYAMMIQRHDLAIMMYQRIAADYANAELLNGEATARLMYAQRLQSDSGGKAYMYPLTLDLSSRVKHWVKDNKVKKKKEKNSVSEDPVTPPPNSPELHGTGRVIELEDEDEKPTRITKLRNIFQRTRDKSDEDVSRKTGFSPEPGDGTPLEPETAPLNSDAPGVSAAAPKLVPAAQRQIEEAISLLERILRVHEPEHLPTLINLACARHMLGQWAQAEETIALATLIAKRDGALVAEDDLRVLQALVLDANGESAAALAKLAKAAERRAELVKANRDAVSGTQTREFKALAEPELIMGQPITRNSHLKNPQLEVKIEAGMIARSHVYVRKRTIQSAEVVEVGVDDRRMFFFAVAKKGYKGASAQGVRLGDDKALVSQKYGSPKHLLSTARGRTIWSYPQGRIFFTLGPAGKVERWTVFYDHLKKP